MTLERTVSVFEAHGFQLELVQGVEETWAEDLAGALERVRHRSGSLLAAMDDAAWAAGLRALESDVKKDDSSLPVLSHHDLVVFKRAA